jgi:hypothetical protein
MKRILLALVGLLAVNATASAQVFVRAPFVRVQTGPGVWVKAPFVDVFVPAAGPVIAPPPLYVVPPPSIYVPPPPTNPPRIEVLPVPQLAPAPLPVPAPGPQPAPTPVPVPVLNTPIDVAPPPVQAANIMTLNQFAASFKPRAGSFEVDLINPITKQPTKVRFTLPDGAPKRVIVDADEVEFRYGLFQFVRIGFTRDGAQVTTRLGR